MEDVNDADYMHAKGVRKDSYLGGCHDLYVQSNTLFLADVFEIFRNVS